MNFGRGGVITLGNVTLYGLIADDSGYSVESIGAALAAGMVVCAGEAVLAKFAERYFANEMKAETPFTEQGAKELMRLGILTIVIPTACAFIAEVLQGIIVGFAGVTTDTIFDISANGDGAVVLGIMFIVMSLLCRYGAEVTEGR